MKNRIVKHLNKNQLSSKTIISIYIVWSFLWLFLFDEALLFFFQENATLFKQQGWLKELFFILISSGLLYWLIQRSRDRNSTLREEIVEGTTEPIFIKDCESRYLFLNQAAANEIGKSISEIFNQTDHNLFGAEQAETLQQTDQEVIKSKCNKIIEETITINGQSNTYLTNKFPRFNRNGNVIGIIGIAHNITNWKTQQQQCQQQLNTIQTITSKAITIFPFEDLMQELLEQLIKILEADLAMIFLQNDQELSLAAQIGDSNLNNSDIFPVNQEIARFIFNTQQGITSDHQLRTYSIQSPYQRYIIGIPLKGKTEAVGVLQLQWQDSYTLTPQQMQFLEITAQYLTLTLINSYLQRQNEKLQQRLQLQWEHSPLAYIIEDIQGNINDWNPAAEQIFGYTKAEVLGKSTFDLMVPDNQKAEMEQVLNRLVKGDMTANGRTKNRTKSGELITCQWHNIPIRDKNGKVIEILSLVENITEQVKLEEQSRQDAYYDPLTELPIRRYLKEQVTRLLETKQGITSFALFHIDLVDFKTIKYSLGHQLAEELLIAISERFTANLPARSVIARIGIDEFAVLLEQVETLEQATYWVKQIQHWLQSPLQLEEHRIFAKVNLGLVLSSQLSDSAEALLQAADTAMHQARLSTTENYVVFDPKMQQQALERLQLDSDMRDALEQGTFKVYYQPIVNLNTRQINGFEALIRWNKQGEWVPPDKFISVAEQTGFIIALDQWMLHEACSQMQQWHTSFPNSSNLFITVNLSAVDLIQPNFVNAVLRILQVTKLAPQHLKLEITETSLIEHPQSVNVILQQLRDHGIQLCIDDFGIGYSSLNYLREFPFDVMKVDRSFVSNLDRDRKSYNLIQTLILLANNLNMSLIAEGIETEKQLKQLKKLGCEQGQGFLFGKPLPSKKG